MGYPSSEPQPSARTYDGDMRACVCVCVAQQTARYILHNPRVIWASLVTTLVRFGSFRSFWAPCVANRITCARPGSVYLHASLGACMRQCLCGRIVDTELHNKQCSADAQQQQAAGSKTRTHDTVRMYTWAVCNTLNII